jgi:predicted DNA-binding transcriptional regulator AlpA
MPLHAQPIAVKEQTAAAMLDMSRAEFRRLVGRSALPPPCQIGETVRWRVADLEEILRGNKRKPDDDDDFE